MKWRNKLNVNCNLDFDDMPSTLMGQFMEALNNPTNLEDLGFNIDGFQGGLECNVDEVNEFLFAIHNIFFLSTHMANAILSNRSSNKNSISMDF